MSRLALVVSRMWLVAGMAACSSPAADSSQPTAAGSVAAGTGGRTGTEAVAGHDAADAGPCTPHLKPTDEFYVACHEVQTGTPDATVDAQVEPPGMDAAVGVDAAVPPAAEPDEGLCAARATSCGATAGHLMSTIGSATCTIWGNALHVEREICETCGKTASPDLQINVRDCGGCEQVYGMGYGAGVFDIAANTCMRRSDDVSLQWTLADPHCVDVYAYLGSGQRSFNGWSLETSDLVRLCRCDRTTDTCVTCMDGACGE
jgi:hypothetical protein